MTLFLRAIPCQPVLFPFSVQGLVTAVRAETGAGTFLSPNLPADAYMAAPFYLFPVVQTQAPAPSNARTRRVEPAAPVRGEDGIWRQAWAERDATAEELALFDQINAPQPQWIEFGLDLASLPAVDGLLATVEAASRPLERMLSGGLLQAAQGDPRTFLAAWAKVVEHGLISNELIQLVAGLASQYDLPADFVAALDL